jgi:DNA polymerase-3 subunit beta
MKVICDRAALADAVNNVSSVVVLRTPTPVLQCVKLSAAGGILTLAATDLEIGLRLGVGEVNVEAEGSALIPADKLKQIVTTCDDPTLTIETSGTQVTIKGASSRFTLNGYDPGEAPTVRDFSDVEVDFEIEGGLFQRLIQRTLFAAAAEHSRYAINGVLIEREGKNLRLVATDGRRLAIARGSASKAAGEKGEKKSCIVPTKALNLISRLVRNPETAVRVAVEDNNALICVGDSNVAGESAVLSTNLVEGTFPPFEDVIPRDQDKKGTFEVAELASAIRRAALLTNEESKGVRMSFKGKELTLTSRAPEMGDAEVHVDATRFDGDSLEIGFNPAFLTDALKVIDDQQVIIELKAPNKPGVIKVGSDFTYVIMPVNLQ